MFKSPSKTKIKPKIEKKISPEIPIASSESKQEVPLLYIDIHLDDQDIFRLTIHEGDNP